MSCRFDTFLTSALLWLWQHIANQMACAMEIKLLVSIDAKTIGKAYGVYIFNSMFMYYRAYAPPITLYAVLT